MTDPGSRGVSSVAFNPANSLLAAGDANGHVYLWGRDQLKETLSDSSGSPIRSVAFSLDNQYLAAGDGRGNVDVWRISTWQRVATMSDPNSGGVNSVAFSSAGLLAAGDANGHVYLWSSDHATTLTDPSGSSVRSVVFTKNSNSLIGGDSSGHVYIWQSATGKVTESFIDPDSRGVESVAYNSDSTVIAAGDGNGQVYLWLNKLQSTIQNPTSDPALSVTYSPNNRYLAIAAASGHVYVRSTTP